MKRLAGVKTVLNKNFKTYDNLDQAWINALGEISKPFTWLIYGHPKQGKTSLLMQFCKEMANHGKVYYNSSEEGVSKTMQEHFKRNNMHELRDGRFMLGDRQSYDDMVATIKRVHPHFIIIDSIDYINLSIKQYKELLKLFPRKTIVCVSWERSNEPNSQHGKDMKHMVDCYSHVDKYVAYTNGRFGSNLKHVIWDRKPQAGDQLIMKVG